MALQSWVDLNYLNKGDESLMIQPQVTEEKKHRDYFSEKSRGDVGISQAVSLPKEAKEYSVKNRL